MRFGSIQLANGHSFIVAWGIALVVLHIGCVHFRWARPSGSDNWPATFGTVNIISRIICFGSPPGLSRGE